MQCEYKGYVHVCVSIGRCVVLVSKHSAQKLLWIYLNNSLYLQCWGQMIKMYPDNAAIS